MNQIPIYLKTDPDMPRPADSEYYLLSGSGMFFGRNHTFFSSEVPARRLPRSLAPHQSSCQVRFPRLGQAALEYIVGFFDRVYAQHGSESIVLLYWDLVRRRYKLVVPKQEATVWEAYSGRRSALDVAYKVPIPPPKDHLLVADIHCHGDFGAYASSTDEKDELHRDGMHAIVGQIEREPPDFHLQMAVDGHRFLIDFDQFFKGYRRRRLDVPKNWLEQVAVKVKRSQSWQYSDNKDYGNSQYGSSQYGSNYGSKYGGNTRGRNYDDDKPGY